MASSGGPTVTGSTSQPTTTHPAGNRPNRTRVRKGKSSKGVPGAWHTRPDGTKVFVAAPKSGSSRPSAPSSASGALLPVARFKGWSPEHQRQALKFYGGDNLTPADFYAMTSKQQREIMERVRTASKVAQAPGSAMAPQSLQDIYKGAEQAAGLKYGSTQRQIGYDTKSSEIQDTRISNQQGTGYFDQYQSILKDAAERTKANYAAQQGQVGADTAAAEAGAAAAQGQVSQAMSADAAQRGAVVDPRIAAEAAQAAASRTADANAVRATIGAQGASTYGYQQNLRGVAANQMVQAHAAERNTRKALQTKLRDLLTEKGQYEQTTRQDLIGAERKSALEQKAFGLDVEQAAAKAASDAAGATATANKPITSGAFAGYTNAQVAQMSERRKNQLKKEFNAGKGGSSASDTTKYFGYTKKEFDAMSPAERREAKRKWDEAGRAPAKGEGKDGKGAKDRYMTPSQQTKVVSQIETMRNMIANPPRWPAGPRKGQPMTTAEVINSLKNGGILVKGKRLDPRYVEVAGNLAANGGKLGPYGVKVAHQARIKIGTAGWGTVGPKPPPTGAAGYNGPH